MRRPCIPNALALDGCAQYATVAEIKPPQRAGLAAETSEPLAALCHCVETSSGWIGRVGAALVPAPKSLVGLGRDEVRRAVLVAGCARCSTVLEVRTTIPSSLSLEPPKQKPATR